MSKEDAPGGRTQETKGKINLDEDSRHAKNVNSTFHNTRRPSIKKLPFFRSSFDSSKGSDELQASLCKTSEVQTNYKRMQRSMSVDTTLDNAVLSHRPRSQRIVLPAFSVRHRNRKAAQSNQTDPVGTSPADVNTIKKDGNNDVKSPEKSNNNNVATTKSDIQLRTMPGRTPPMNKTVNLSLARDQLRSLDATDGHNKRGGGEISEKLRLDLGDSADDSFCWWTFSAWRDEQACTDVVCLTKWLLTARTVLFIFYHNRYI